MNIEGKIRDCEYNLKQINHFNPDPFYVNHFFKAYLQSVIDVYDEILEEADRDFGLNAICFTQSSKSYSIIS